MLDYVNLLEAILYCFILDYVAQSCSLVMLIDA